MTIHDHFDGSAHCVECKGHCQQTGFERGATEIVRWMLERFAYRGFRHVPVSEAESIRKMGADPEKLMQRAVETSKPRSGEADKQMLKQVQDIFGQ